MLGVSFDSEDGNKSALASDQDGGWSCVVRECVVLHERTLRKHAEVAQNADEQHDLEHRQGQIHPHAIRIIAAARQSLGDRFRRAAYRHKHVAVRKLDN
eukprot:6046561-Pleurochrysis_carterae.AAC.2